MSHLRACGCRLKLPQIAKATANGTLELATPPWRTSLQALLALINSRRPMGTEALSAPPLPKLMVGADDLPQ